MRPILHLPRSFSGLATIAALVVVAGATVITGVTASAASVDAARIGQAIDHYGEGLRTGNVDLLERAFHPRAIMTGHLGDDLLIIPIQEMYESVRTTPSPMETGEPFSYELVDMHIVGGTATADVLETSFRGFDFLTRFHLVRIDGDWRIVSKIFSITGPAEGS